MKEKTPVLINLLATARYEHMPDYPVQFMTKGKLTIHSPEKAMLEYREIQQDDDTGEVSEADITLSMEQNRLTMIRKGTFSNTMVFVPEQRFEGVYKTPYGEMDLSVYSFGVQCNIGKDHGSIHLKYQLNLQGSYASSNELHLEYMAENGGKSS